MIRRTMLVLLLAYFTWLATYRAVINDDRIARGEAPLEALDNEKVLVWPDLVYTELICIPLVAHPPRSRGTMSAS